MIVKNGVFRYMFVAKDYAASIQFYGTLLGLRWIMIEFGEKTGFCLVAVAAWLKC